MKLNKKLGTLLLGIWLILTGLVHVIDIPIPNVPFLLAALAIAAGVLLVLGK